MINLLIKWSLLAFALALITLAINPLIELIKVEFNLSINFNYYLSVFQNFCFIIAMGCLSIGIILLALVFWKVSQKIT